MTPKYRPNTPQLYILDIGEPDTMCQNGVASIAFCFLVPGTSCKCSIIQSPLSHMVPGRGQHVCIHMCIYSVIYIYVYEGVVTPEEDSS